MDKSRAAAARLVSSKAQEANLWRIVPALGMAQIVSWGSLYYAIAVLGESMQRDLGVGPVVLYGAFTASLVLSGFAAPYIGRTIDARGGGTVLPIGSVIAGIAMLMLAAATGPATLIAGWLVAGLAMSAVLYDPAFATLTRIAGPSYRTAITALTLFGGLASTVFWPASQYLMDAVGWRQTLVIYGALHLLVCLPIHAFMVPRQTRRESTPTLPTQPPATPARRHGFLFLAIAFALSSFVFSALSVHLISMLKVAGLDAGSAVWIAAIIGPMQVMGRIGEFAFGRGIRPSSVGAMALGLLLIAILLLMVVPGPGGIAIGFAVAYGCSNGIMTIARGTVPAQLFGREGYGELLGRFARVVSSATAAAPIAVALLLSGGISYAGIKAVLALCLLVALPCYWIALHRHRAGARRAVLA
jgi:predicted MFS family arabinose efflux permease